MSNQRRKDANALRGKREKKKCWGRGKGLIQGGKRERKNGKKTLHFSGASDQARNKEMRRHSKKECLKD